MKFYTIKLPKFLGGIVKVMLNSFKKINNAGILKEAP
ncbi:stage V sporulation protein SpoVM [Bacillus megaterium]|nr:stage V sporulation protein SpoVM [Priestia megaterium]